MLRLARWFACLAVLVIVPDVVKAQAPTACGQCDLVYKTSLAICSMYGITGNKVAAGICVAAATYGYMNCAMTNCVAPSPNFGDDGTGDWLFGVADVGDGGGGSGGEPEDYTPLED
jgi:hypothetical protein